ncbi:MAG: hypothetical protein AAF978_07755, partial [Cyanobacteria bacterium P01_E01_bin.48]
MWQPTIVQTALADHRWRWGIETLFTALKTRGFSVDGSVSQKQGIRIGFTDGSRIVFRLSGT